MEVPKHLSHQPIIGVDDYNLIDGKYNPQKTDAQALSIGIAQYDEDKEEISAKVFRMVNGVWSRQSEELPMHRVLDLAILIIATMKTKGTSSEPITNLKETVINPYNLDLLQNYLEENSKHLLPRLEELKRLLNN